MTLAIHTYGSDVLRKVAQPIENIDDTIRKLVDEMFVSMHAAEGIGLAAPQIGESIRLFIIDIAPIDENEGKRVYVNPQIIGFGDEEDEYEEVVKEETVVSRGKGGKEIVELRCPECGTLVAETEDACPGCGVTFEEEEVEEEINISQFECPECGNLVAETDGSCPGCGVEFVDEEEEEMMEEMEASSVAVTESV